MTEIQQAAYVISQSACLMAEIEGMKVANEMAKMQGDSLPHGKDSFTELAAALGVHHNDVMEMYRN